ncbi:hypothetical protein cypCar_00005519, partial [Cyprinus carpio]
PLFSQKLHAEDELPDSVLTYVEASRNRMNTFEQVILEDVEEKDFSSQNLSHLNRNEPASDFIDDPMKWKDRVISDIEPQNAQWEIPNMPGMEDDIDTESELQLSLEWRELEKRLREEEEQKLAAQEVERELHLNSEIEEEERRRRGLIKFQEELKMIEEATWVQNVGVKNEVHHTEDLQLELDKQQNLIRKLEEQMEEEKQAFEKAQEEERRKTQKLQCTAATKIQAALRGTLVRRWSKIELRRKKEEERRHEEEKRKWEKMKKEREEERKRIEEEERTQREEMERRRADYERAKEQERHRLEKEQRLEQQKRKEEEDEKRKKIQKKEMQNNTASVKDDYRRQEEDVGKKNKEKERKIVERSSQVKDECKREEERGEIENERIRQGKKMENTLEDDRNTMKKQDKTKSKDTEDTERSDDTEQQTESDKDRIKSHKEEKTIEISGELDSRVNRSQSGKSLKVTKTTTESHINVHQGLSSDLGISPVGSSSVADHLRVKAVVKTDLAVQVSDLAVVTPEMDTRGHQNTTAIELEDHKPKSQKSISICLPDSTEQKRLAWMMNCTPWSKLSLQNKRKGSSAQQQSQKRGPRKRRVPSLPPLTVDTILKTGAWSSLKQVTTVTLEDLPGCSLSTLSECNKLQTLTLRRCGLTTLDGLNQCTQIRCIDVQVRKNKLSNADCIIFKLSSGLGPLKMLLRLSVDHNQLLSTKGLNEIYTLLHLDCSYNHLSHIEGLENCALLNTLDLRGNSLTELPVLQNHVLLRDLYLDDNLISSVHDLESYWLPLLQNLSVAHNSVTHLIPLLDLVSLKTLDASHNCLLDLQNVCLNLQECTSLQELNLTGNPLQQESNWRSLLLETVPGLIKLNNEQIAAAAASCKCPEQQWSFHALCQAQQEQRDSLLQQQKMEISSASSQHDVQILAIGHQIDLFRLAVDQRYAHEYGDSCVTEDSTLMAAANSSSCGYSEASQGQNPDWQRHNPQKTQLSPSDLELQSAHCMQTQTSSIVFKAAWRGYVLRKNLARALAAAQITESDEDLEEVDMDEFIFDEKALEKDWRTLHSDALPARMMPFLEQLPLPKSPLCLPMPPKTLSVFPLQPKHAWSDNEGAACSEQSMSPHLSSRSIIKTHTLSEKSEKILKEWGITNESTALLMLKRANKMKGRKQQQKRLIGRHIY